MKTRACLRPALLSSVALCAAVAGACGGSSSTSSKPSSSPLVVGRTADIDTLDPYAATAFQTEQTLELIYGGLTQLDAKLDVVPGLAQSWSFSDGGRRLTFKLRGGVRFQDGSSFDAADVKASFDRLLDPETGAVGASNLSAVSAIQTPDAQTVVLRLKRPDASIPASLAHINTAMLSADDIKNKTVGKKTNGTGPFTLKTRIANQRLTLAPNARWWGGKVKLRGITFRVIPNEKSVVSAVQSGNVQLGLLSDPLVAKTVTSGGGHKLLKTPSVNYHVFMLNARAPALRDQNVRAAIACAVDRKAVLSSAALGEGTVIGPITSPAYESDPNARPCPTPDLAKAKSLLAKAGKSSGLTIKTIVETGEYSTAVNEAQSLQAQLKKVGIDLKLDILEAGPYVKAWLAEDFDAAVALNGGDADPNTMYGRYFAPGGSLNKQGLTNATFTKLLAQGQSTTAPAQRKPIYAQFSRALEDVAPWVWLFSGNDYYFLSDKVKGFTPMPNASLQFLAKTSLSG
jgi:peptide/nickel transport system substrate-binding protein